MKAINITIIIILISFGSNAQNWNPNGENSTTGHLTLDGSHLNIINPSISGYWARGFYNIDVNKTTKIGGVGLFGQGNTPIHYYIAHGEAPWNSNKGLYIKTNGNVGVGTTNPLGKLYVNGETYIENGWMRIKGNKGIYFQDYGGGFFMQDDNWIRTYGNKNFYHNTGVMRTDGRLEVGPSGNRFVVDQNGFVGVGLNNPGAQLHVVAGVQFRKTTIGLTSASSDNSWIRDEWLTGSYGPAKWNQDKKKWIRPGGTHNDIGGIVFQDEGTYFLRDRAGTKLEYTNGEFLNTAFMFANINNGNVGIGTTTPDSKLTVKGKIHAEEVKIDLSVPAPDYVFKKDYDLLTIEEVQQHILEKGHLPNIPSAKVMETEGVDLGTMNMKLLEKIEELILYTIGQEKELKTQEKRIKNLEKKLEYLLNKN